MGNKYGYRPFPTLIEEREFQKLAANLKSNPDLYDIIYYFNFVNLFTNLFFSNLIEQWYVLDTNSILLKLKNIT